jgi:hypothetical protein
MKPAGEYSQADVADFVVDLREAHSDCQGKLAAVRLYVDRAVPEAVSE